MLPTSLHEIARQTPRRLSAADGQTTTEYGMLLGIIAIVIVVLVMLVGSEISSLFVPVIHYF